VRPAVLPPPPGRESKPQHVVAPPTSAPPFSVLPSLLPGVDLSDIEPPPPCPVCGSLELWQDMLVRSRCQRCEVEKFYRALRWAKRAAQLRQLYPAPPTKKRRQKKP
jgi:hypothetical protein